VAIEYTLRCETAASHSEIGNTLVELCGFVFEGADVVPLGRHPQLAEEEEGVVISYQAPGLRCVIHPESRLGKELMEEAVGLHSTCCITFRIDKFDGYDDGMTNMICACISVIKKHAPQCVLLANHHVPLLVRKSRKLTLQSRDPFWRDKLEIIASEIGDPASFAPIPSL